MTETAGGALQADTDTKANAAPPVRLLHTADWHLGRKQFDVVNARGINQREADAEDALANLFDAVLEEAPDVMLVGGDVFHTVRPPNRSILFLFEQFQRLRTGLPQMQTVLISGNHDQARTTDAAQILPLYRALGVHVVTNGIERVKLNGLTVTCVPSIVARCMESVEPEPGVLNVLLGHGDARGLHPGTGDFDPASVTGKFDYVALGDYHVFREVAPRVVYSGAIDYSSTNPWGELREEEERGLGGKGYVIIDLPDGAPEFRRFIGPRARPRQSKPAEPLPSKVDETVNAWLAQPEKASAMELLRLALSLPDPYGAA